MSWDLGLRVTDWSYDGSLIAFRSMGDLETKTDVYVLRLDGRRETLAIASTAFEEDAGTFSPDGNWLAYVSDESGRPEVYVQSFQGFDSVSDASERRRVQVSLHGGQEPISDPVLTLGLPSWNNSCPLPTNDDDADDPLSRR